MQEEQMQQQQEAQEAMLQGGGEEVPLEEGEEEEPIQAMEKAYKPPSQRKFKGRTGGITPDWHDKGDPSEERDIDEYAEARARKNELTLSKSWVESLIQKGFTSPLIKEVAPDLTQMWFSENNIDYVAQLSNGGVTTVEKAVFADPTRFSRNKQERPKPTQPTETDIDENY